MGDTRKAILLMNVVSLLFAIQDGFSRQLGTTYSPFFVVMLRYWFFAVFVIVLVSRAPGGLRAAVRSRRPVLQIARALLLIADVVMMIFAFVRLGLVATHAVFAIYPLLIVALSALFLGERVGWRRRTAVAVGFVGILIILQPGRQAISPDVWLPLGSALCFALYGVLTRRVAAEDSALVSFFWTAIWGAIAATALGLWFMEPLAPRDWIWLAGLCIAAALSHGMLIRAYELAEASLLQPFSYAQLAWVSLIGVSIFGEQLRANVVLGVLVIVGAGLFTLWRARVTR